MSMIGAQFVGTSAARDQASKMFRQLNKVVLATVLSSHGHYTDLFSGRMLEPAGDMKILW